MAQHDEYVCWEFGDGIVLDSREAGTADYTELLLEHGGDVRNPVHTYADIGTYTVTQTVYNLFDGGSTDSASMTLCIMGDPIVTFKDGNTVYTATVPYNGIIPQTLSADQIPQINDDRFEGWYYDKGYTEEWNPEDEIDSHKTLYAKYTPSQSDSPFSSSYLIVILVILAIAVIGVLLARRKA